MASTDEKPNLRPTKRNSASGKSLYLHHNPHQLSNKSYIQATWNNEKTDVDFDENNPFGIQQPNIAYSLNKHQRWDILDDFRQYIANQSGPSSDDEMNTHSDSELRRKVKKKTQRKTKYRLYEYQTTELKANCMRITSNSAERRSQTPRKTYINASNDIINKSEQNNDDNNKLSTMTTDVTYVAVLPPSRGKYLSTIRKHHGTKSKKIASSVQRTKFTQNKEQVDVVEQFEEESDNLSTDEDESTTTHYTSIKPNQLQLNDFISITSANENNQTSPKSSHMHSNNRTHRQISKERKLYYEDQTTSLRQQEQKDKITKAPKKATSSSLPPPESMPLTFHTVYISKSDCTIEYLSKTYGKNFIQAQCYPTKYLICLTDRLKSFPWPNKLAHFPNYAMLNCYLILTPNNEECPLQAQIAINIDLNRNPIQMRILSESNDKVYQINQLIDIIIEYITRSSYKIFKPIESGLSKIKYPKNQTDDDLSENEFVNKQIRQAQSFDRNDLQTKLTMEELKDHVPVEIDPSTRPEICMNCYSDMDESIAMTALTSCGHWFCNECWKQYLENSIKRVKIILCPEWNCCSIVDVGTILSLVNVHYMNIYKSNIEKCLVNLSRTYVKCPSKPCSNIFQVIGSTVDNVRCPCGHQFCIDCKQEPHFPARCASYQAYIAEARQNGDLTADYDAKITVQGRNCVSCNLFIEKNGGCNHMTCRCGAEFCWLCTSYWKDHYTSSGIFTCPKPQIFLQKKIITKEHTQRNASRKFYEQAIYHRHERTYHNQIKQNENCRRLIGTIPLDKGDFTDSTTMKSKIDKRDALLRHVYEMVKYISYLHRVCECVAVAADGYANNPREFSNSLYLFESLVFNLSHVLEVDRGYKAIERLNDLHQTSEKLLERLRHTVTFRQKQRINSTGYTTS